MALPHHIYGLEAESLSLIRRVLSDGQPAASLFSGGKDSMVLLHLISKVGIPAHLEALHIDTGHNFPEILTYRDEVVSQYGIKLTIGYVEEDLRAGKAEEQFDLIPSRNAAQSVTLKRLIKEKGYRYVFGGGRRDEEKARAKERMLSIRNEDSSWQPENQQPELWNLLHTQASENAHFRVFPLSNWTEADIWAYIQSENIRLPSLYFSHQREIVARKGMLMAVDDKFPLLPGEQSVWADVRFRTIGDISCTGAIYSRSTTVSEVISELQESRLSERGLRADDKVKPAAMEARKRDGYF